jgi:hypothetical protein
VTDAQLLEAHQQLPKPIQPGARALDHQAARPALRMRAAGGATITRSRVGVRRRTSCRFPPRDPPEEPESGDELLRLSEAISSRLQPQARRAASPGPSKV